MERLKVFEVLRCLEGEVSIVGVFSSREFAQHFIKEVYSDSDIDLCWIDEHTIDLYQCQKDDVFVYEVMLESYDETTTEEMWSINFIGYSMDLSDRRGIVFCEHPGIYTVVVLAKTASSAMELGKDFITKAREGGPFINGDYSRPGYIKAYNNV